MATHTGICHDRKAIENILSTRFRTPTMAIKHSCVTFYQQSHDRWHLSGLTHNQPCLSLPLGMHLTPLLETSLQSQLVTLQNYSTFRPSAVFLYRPRQLYVSALLMNVQNTALRGRGLRHLLARASHFIDGQQQYFVPGFIVAHVILGIL